ncbi:MAG TPA: LOG family protein [Candidatus Poseidoniales archaeon]|jgi:uncharacterized protein (TIGR00730 family)|nr:MAG: lysine decarboxylase [Euryarchaeota archaeon]HIF15835.1 LOG family protein [Candidatus Poseidoniales archaeon]
MSAEDLHPNPPWKDIEWLESKEARVIRMMAEFVAPETQLINKGFTDTVVFFGSARTSLSEPDCLAATEIARRLSEWAITPRAEGGGARDDGSQRFHVCTGAGPGIMEASNKGAYEAEAGNIGLGIELPFEPGINKWVSPDLGFQFKYFAMRKFWFVYPAKAILVFPGGFGTLDELFEVLTLIQTGKISKKLPIILWNTENWKRLIDWDLLIETGMISPGDMDLLHFSSDVDEVVSLLLEHLGSLPEVVPSAP